MWSESMWESSIFSELYCEPITDLKTKVHWKKKNTEKCILCHSVKAFKNTIYIIYNGITTMGVHTDFVNISFL